MGIDRIGKGPASPAVPPSAVAPTRPDRTGSSTASPAVVPPFDAASGAVAQSPPAALASASGALHELRSGGTTLDAYLDAKVDEATSSLTLAPGDVSAIRAALRDRLASDPTLVELVRVSTGANVSAPRDE